MTDREKECQRISTFLFFRKGTSPFHWQAERKEAHSVGPEDRPYLRGLSFRIRIAGRARPPGAPLVISRSVKRDAPREDVKRRRPFRL